MCGVQTHLGRKAAAAAEEVAVEAAAAAEVAVAPAAGAAVAAHCPEQWPRAGCRGGGCWRGQGRRADGDEEEEEEEEEGEGGDDHASRGVNTCVLVLLSVRYGEWAVPVWAERGESQCAQSADVALLTPLSLYTLTLIPYVLPNCALYLA